jgi:hypothetical protein
VIAILIFLMWLTPCAALMAFIEYVLHRWPMHSGRLANKYPVFWKTFEAHGILHHGRYFKRFDYEPDRAAYHFNIIIEPGYALLGLSPLWGVLMLLSFPAGLAMAAVVLMHSLVWSGIHSEMHMPEKRWFWDTAYYKYARDYHHTHHVHPGSNFCVVFPPFMDMLFGTYRAPTTPPCSQPPVGWY